MSAVIIIPARYASTRLPGKPLTEIAGKSLVRRVYENAMAVGDIDAVYVATDDERIAEHVTAFGGKALMTSKTLRNGTDRCFAAAQSLPERPEIVINLQGDAPLLPPLFLEGVLQVLKKDPSIPLATAAVRMNEQMYQHAINDYRQGRAGGTTVVFKPNGQAMYFSKAPIPFLRNYEPGKPLPVFKHIGVYGFRYTALEQYVHMTPTHYEEIEGLEQMRAMEHDMPIHVVPFEDYKRTIWGVDSPEDVKRVEQIIAEEGEILG